MREAYGRKGRKEREISSEALMVEYPGKKIIVVACPQRVFSLSLFLKTISTLSCSNNATHRRIG